MKAILTCILAVAYFGCAYAAPTIAPKSFNKIGGGYGKRIEKPAAGYGKRIEKPAAGYGKRIEKPAAGYGKRIEKPTAGYGKRTEIKKKMWDQLKKRKSAIPI